MFDILRLFVYGLISGLSETLPVSSRGHQSVLMQLFGMSHRDPVLDLLVHLSILACVIFCCREEVFRYTHSVSLRGRKMISKQAAYDTRLLRTATLPVIVGTFFFALGTKYEVAPLNLVFFMIINGVILIVPDYVRQSNKNAGQITFIDSFLIGLTGLVNIFPGISRVAAGTSYALLRGTDKQNAYNWLLLLTVPSLAALIIVDIIGLFTLGLTGVTIWLFIGYLLAIAAAFVGSYIGISLMRFLAVNSGFSVFGYYSLGLAAFTFIIYLIAF